MPLPLEALLSNLTYHVVTVGNRVCRLYSSLSPARRITVLLVALFTACLGAFILTYSEGLFHALSRFAHHWEELRAGSFILWLLIFAVSFPPLIGYSSCVMLAGFMYGVVQGWIIVCTATVVGSTAAFLLSRHVLHDCVSGFIGRDSRFTALSMVLGQDGLKPLLWIRLCPLPYSLSNGALATLPSIRWLDFALATAMASPKLILHVFVGSRWRTLVDSGKEADFKTRALGYLSVLLGIIVLGVAGWWMVTLTKQRVRDIEHLEYLESQRGILELQVERVYSIAPEDTGR